MGGGLERAESVASALKRGVLVLTWFASQSYSFVGNSGGGVENIMYTDINVFG